MNWREWEDFKFELSNLIAYFGKHFAEKEGRITEADRLFLVRRISDLKSLIPYDADPNIVQKLDSAFANYQIARTELTYNGFGMLLAELYNLARATEQRETAKTKHYEGNMERRLGELEAELEGFRSNPALGKKIAKLEEKLEKLKVASVAITEDSEKEQEDMLKQYRVAKKKVFVIMPFAPVFDDAWHGGIKRACNSEDIGYLRVDKISLSSWITEDIKNYLDMADFVIVDTTGNNPNVMFEFGWALALKKKPIVIRQKDDPNILPFDVKDIRHISYLNNWSGIENLYSEICKFLRTTSETSEEQPTEEKKEKKKKS